MQDSVTVVIHFFNSSGTIKRAIESVRKQTYKDWQLLLIDDGSEDGSADVVKSAYGDEYEIVSVPQRLGVTGVRNFALSMIETPYIAWLDSDDVMEPARLKDQISHILVRPDVVAVTSWVKTFGLSTELYKPPYTADNLRYELFFRNPIVFSSVTMKNPKGFAPLKFRDEIWRGQDYPFWFDLCKFGKFETIPKVLTLHCLHSRQVSRLEPDASRSAERTVRYEAARLVHLPPLPLDASPICEIAWMLASLVQNLIHPTVRTGAIVSRIRRRWTKAWHQWGVLSREKY